ncbi:hypothetical protein C173_32241 [Paenibacillus sp. FSL R7-277]|uniref:hypothetical protein n=1 Tax=Paenibacillus sp. FSL R7-277 TaxID=1227352 RepID=UPI0003E2BD61|nr:hypothetical protein [Paenibacillus sp. FSL R7-277]ETT57075.1 hypothetical protein C173_32241 [Paenibacillus sp. FSL R7-277]
MLEIDDLMLETIVKFTIDNEEAARILGEIAQYVSKSNSSIITLPQDLDCEETSVAIKENILIRTPDGISFVYPQYLLFFLARSLITIRFETLWEKEDEFWAQIEYLNWEFEPSEMLRYTEVMLLIILNRMYEKDILKSLISSVKVGNQRVHWTLLKIVSSLLPYLQLDTKSIVVFFEEMHNANISSIDVLTEVVDVLVKKNSKVGQELWEMWTRNPKFKAVWLLKSVATALVHKEGIVNVYNRAVELMDSPEESLIKAGISICGLLPYEKTTENLLNYTLDKFDKLLQQEFRIQLRLALIQSYGRLISKSKRAQLAVRMLSKESFPEIQEQIANILYLQGGNYQDEIWFQETLIQLSKVSVEQKGTIDNLDYTLNRIVSTNFDCIKKFLESWILEHEAPSEKESITELFDMMFYTLLQKHKSWFEELLTSYFIQDDVRFHLHIQEMMKNLHHNGGIFHLNSEIISEWSYKEIKFVLMKIMGFVFDNKNLCHLAFSILRRTPEDEAVNKLVHIAFREYIAYNYPGVASEFLNDKVENGTALERRIANSILTDLNSYRRRLEELPRIKEFYPPEGRASKFEKMHSRLMSRQIAESANETSLFSNLIHRVLLKGGKASFSKIEGEYTDKMEFSEMSVSMEFPRGENLDPTGQAMKRFGWRTCQQEDLE